MKKNKPVIFILGAAGQVGRELCNNFSKKYSVYAFARNKFNLNNFKKNKNLKFIKHNFEKNIKINKIPHIIINCIVTHEFSKKSSYDEIIKKNVNCLKNILELSKNKKTILINLSSVAVYGEFMTKTIDENSNFKNQEILGLTKLISEKYFTINKKELINLRLPGVLTKSSENRRPWLKKIINDIKNSKNLIIFNKNEKFNGIITPEDIYSFCDTLVNKKKINFGTYLFAARNPIKIYEIINFIIKHYNSKSKIKYVNSNKITPVFDTKKIEKKLLYKNFTTKKIIENYLSS